MLRSGTTNILIDSGSSDQKKLGSRTLEPCLKSKGISRLDIAVVSHGDSDHISGLLYLLEQKMPIDLLILPAGGKGERSTVNWNSCRQKQGEKHITCTREIR